MSAALKSPPLARYLLLASYAVLVVLLGIGLTLNPREVLAGPAALAGEPRPVAEDAVLEKRVMSLADELRCLVCQNQSIAESNAGLAVDLRNQVRVQMKEGKSNEEIVDYMAARYGDFVLYRPPLKATTLVLWVGPLLLLLGAVGALFYRLARRAPDETADLSESDRARAASLLAADEMGEKR